MFGAIKNSEITRFSYHFENLVNSIFIEGINLKKVTTGFQEIDLGKNVAFSPKVAVKCFEMKDFLNNLPLEVLSLPSKSIKILEELVKRELRVKGDKYKEIGIYKYQNGFCFNINGLKFYAQKNI